MTLIEFTDNGSGEPVALNPAHVISVEPYATSPPAATICTRGEEFVVRGAYADVLAALRADRDHKP